MDNIIDKIKNGVELTSDEVEKTIWSFDQVKTIVGESRRWSQSCEVILKIDGKLYSVEYDKGLTENQENEYVQKIQQYNQNIKAAEEDLLGYIRPQIRIDECTKAKTEYSLKFPSAKISFSREVPFLIKPEDIDKVPDKYIKTKKEVDWENYKKTLLIHNNNAIDKETGEVKPVQIGTKAGGVLKIKIL